MTDFKKGPQKGAGRNLAARLKGLSEQKPPQSLVDKINRLGNLKRSARPRKVPQGLDA